MVGDRIEAGTMAVAAAMAGGEVEIRGINPLFLQVFLNKLREIGVDVEEGDDSMTVHSGTRPPCRRYRHFTYPGFPTDLQPPMMVLLSMADGTSVLTENVFESRFIFVDELNRMGCNISIEGHHAIIRGGGGLSGAEVYASDLRAGAAWCWRDWPRKGRRWWGISITSTVATKGWRRS